MNAWWLLGAAGALEIVIAPLRLLCIALIVAGIAGLRLLDA